MKIYRNYAFLKGEKNMFIALESTTGMVADATSTSNISISTGESNQMEFYKWGVNNDMPDKLIENAYKNNIVASNLDFNSRIAYGEDVMPVRRTVENGEVKHTPLLREEAPKIFDFLEENNYSYIQNELSHDLTLLANGFVEFIFNRRKTNIIQIRHMEASYSRLEVMDNKGVINNHGYHADWKNANIASDDSKPVITPLLDFGNPIRDINVRLGRLPGADGKQARRVDGSRYVMHLGQPSPGKFYYQKAYWWSIFESHWFDFSCAIPEFKMNLMKNQMVLKYHIQIRKGFFTEMYAAEGITDIEKQVARREEFFSQLENFLSGKENAGKNIVTEVDYDTISKAVEIKDMIITPIESFIKGGEYIEDSEEASNAICYAMGVHPSLQGASPGKNKTINGTEARELFIIKQSMMASVRRLLLQPLYLVKSVNNWNKDIDFIIPNIMLTTLDRGTGAVKQIGNQIQ